MDEPHTPISSFRNNAFIARLVAQAPLLLMIAVVFLGLVLVADLQLQGAVLGYLVVTLGVGLLARAGQDEADVAPPASSVPLENLRIQDFADALPDPCLVLDRRGAVVHGNAAARSEFPAATIGNPLTFALRNPQLVLAVDAAMRTGGTQTIELHETIPSETWQKVVVAPLHQAGRDWLKDPAGQIIVTAQNLTELKRVDALRSDFIANASHELRTPLASLRGFIETLQGPAARDEAARTRFLGIMRNQAERMGQLIDDLLSLSRIEMHQHIRPTQEIDLAGLLREVCDGLSAQAKAADLELSLKLGEGSAMTLGDRNQLYEVFENLIDNAIKYGATGEAVEVELEPANRSGFRHLVRVTDHGPGIDAQHVPRLTERFYRIDAEAGRRTKGTGLGLAIVKHTVQRHRGELSIRSRPGEGMRVEVLLH